MGPMCLVVSMKRDGY